jgi:hypothetical protein
MSRAEDNAKPILTALISNIGAARTLDVDERQAIAMWIAIKSVVLDYYAIIQGKRPTPFFSPQQRTSMRLNEQPPSRITVYLARLKQLPSASHGDVQTLYYSKFFPKSAKHLRTFVVTISINHLIIQLIASRMVKRVPLVEIDFNYNVVGYPWPSLAPEIWPSIGDVEWPSLRPLNRFDTLAYRLGERPGD